MITQYTRVVYKQIDGINLNGIKIAFNSDKYFTHNLTTLIKFPRQETKSSLETFSSSYCLADISLILLVKIYLYNNSIVESCHGVVFFTGRPGGAVRNCYEQYVRWRRTLFQHLPIMQCKIFINKNFYCIENVVDVCLNEKCKKCWLYVVVLV